MIADDWEVVGKKTKKNISKKPNQFQKPAARAAIPTEKPSWSNIATKNIQDSSAPVFTYSAKLASAKQAEKKQTSDDECSNCSETTGTTATIPEKFAFWTSESYTCLFPECKLAATEKTVEEKLVAAIKQTEIAPVSVVDPVEAVFTTNPIQALAHLREKHNLEIKNFAEVIAVLDEYLKYWIERITLEGIDKVCTRTDEKNNKDETIYCLGDPSLEEDQQYRLKLQKQKLDEMMKIQEKDRSPAQSAVLQKCLFCTVEVERSAIFRHMYGRHSFNVGYAENLVQIGELLSLLEQKLTNLQCLYCERVFKNETVLRQHMKKKKHLKINSKNHEYDRFYIVNYLEPGKNWKDLEADDLNVFEDDENWDDWDEELVEPTMCLFDDQVLPSTPAACQHMITEHGFDLKAICKDKKLDFYQEIRLINYIRKQTSLFTCFSCKEKTSSMQELAQHLKDSNHYSSVPDVDSADFWKDPQYLFPTFENDPLLFDGEDLDFSDDEKILTKEELLKQLKLKEKGKELFSYKLELENED